MNKKILGTSLIAILFWVLGCVSHQTEIDHQAWSKNKVNVNGLNMAYYESGEGRPIVLLHGNPASSYQWRKVIPHIQHLGRIIAPDMIGMGDSDPLPDSGPGKYSYLIHRDYLFGLFNKLGIEDDVLLVATDWGSALGFDWAFQNPGKVRGIAYFEAIVFPADFQMEDPTGGMFTLLRTPKGEELLLEKNMMLEKRYIERLGYYLTEKDRVEYRRPYLKPGESRRPMLAWTRQLPIDGEPEVNNKIIKEYSTWLSKDVEIPKLFLRGEPGALLANKQLLDFVRTFRNQKEVMVYGAHNLHETSPDAIGRALAEWISELE